MGTDAADLPIPVDNGPDLETTLHDRFGLERFRPGQREVIEAVLAGRDVLCVMPTGGGKSLCYQLPALLLNGPTLVVSPLIALMKDQVDVLVARGIRATFLNSSLDPSEQTARLREIEIGRYDLVYVAPERFQSGRFFEAMTRARPSLLAIDEAHCISEWGHDFRPDYAKLGQARKRLGSPPCVALTATATDLVRKDIVGQLDLDDPATFVTGFDRPNLSYRVFHDRRDADKLASLGKILGRIGEGSAVVYASSRAKCETIYDHITGVLKKPATLYHAGLDREARSQAQDRFMSGQVPIVVATNAFGMGVDKSDIRAVIHFSMPGTLEAYYQEAGRAGRDGKPSECALLFSFSDRRIQEMFIENEFPAPEFVKTIYDFLRRLNEDPIELTHAEIKEKSGVELAESAVGTALKVLDDAGAIERFRPWENMAIVRLRQEPDGLLKSFVDRLHPQAHVQRIVLAAVEGLINGRWNEPVYIHPDDLAGRLGLERTALVRALRAIAEDVPLDYIPPFRGNAVRVLNRSRTFGDLRIDSAHQNKRKRQQYGKLDRVIDFAQTNGCRRAFILSYFGEKQKVDCGNCDNCSSAQKRKSPTLLSEEAEPKPNSSQPTSETPSGTAQAAPEVILKLLSGVARARGKFGKQTIAQMLNGSRSEKMTRWGLDQLKTFGILGQFTQAEIVSILDAAESKGWIESRDVDSFRPVVQVTESGWAVLRGQGETDYELDLPATLRNKMRLPAPSASPAKPRDDIPLPTRTEPHLQVARPEMPSAPARPRRSEEPTTVKASEPSVRKETSEARVVPPSPATPIIPTRSEPVSAPMAPARPEPTPRPAPAPAGAYVSTEEWTWRLLDRGFSLDDATAIRGLEPMAIQRHALWMARQGKAIPLSAFLTPDRIAEWTAWHRAHGATPPPPDHGATPSLWELFLLSVQGSPDSVARSSVPPNRY